MPFKSGARIRETSTTVGTGTYTLDGAPAGFQPFSALGANEYCKYFATDGTNWEEGIGRVLTGPARLERTTILGSSNAGAAVNWGAGTRTLRCGPVAAMDLPRMLTKSVAGGAGTTALTQDEQRRQVIEFTGALTGDRVIEVDTSVWPCIYYNNTSGAFSLTVKVAGQTGVAIPQGRRMLLYCDGVDVRPASPSVSGVNGSEFAGGATVGIVFAMAAAPVGWTKSTTHNDKALRVVSGTGAGSGGATGFSSVFGAGKVTGATTLSVAQTPSHNHPGTSASTTLSHSIAVSSGGGFVNSTITEANQGASFLSASTSVSVAAEGGSGSHDHTLSLNLAYVDVIICTKD